MPVLVWGWEVSVMPQVPPAGLCMGLAEVGAARQVPVCLPATGLQGTWPQPGLSPAGAAQLAETTWPCRGRRPPTAACTHTPASHSGDATGGHWTKPHH